MPSSFIIRPVRREDLLAILAIAKQTGPGFNSLPNQREAIEAKITRSLQSFSQTCRDYAFYFFVMEDLNTQEIAGTAGIEAYIGHPWPFYKFKLSTLVQASESLHMVQKHTTLHLVTEHEGATELGALYLKPEFRGGGRGSFLSRARCLFIAEFLNLFSERIISDLRGVSNKDAISPFWEAVGRKFFHMEYEEASFIKSVEGSQFLIDLVPHDPIYMDLLSIEAQQVIGKTHENSSPARHVLEKEGFQFRGYIDIFDAGPTIEIEKRLLRTVRESQKTAVIGFQEKINSNELMLLGNESLDYRAAVGVVEFSPSGGVILETDLAKKLNIVVGDPVRFSPFH